MGVRGNEGWLERAQKKLLAKPLLRVEDVAEQVGFGSGRSGATYFGARFKDATGKTPTQFRRDARETASPRPRRSRPDGSLAGPSGDSWVQKAKDELLVVPEKPVHEIARNVGFTHPGQFSREFKRATGLTPTAWRREQRGLS